MSHGNPLNTASINLSNVAGALHSPNGMTVNCHSPCPNEKAVFSLLAGSSSTSQYPLFRSMVEKHLAPFKASRVTGASVAQWSERSPFTSEVAGSILSENFLNVTQTQCSTHVKKVCQRSAESRGFSPGTPVSSQREVDRVG